MSSLGHAGMAARNTALVGSAFALTGATAYGINIVGARLAAQFGITGADVVTYRSLILLPLLAVALLATGRRLWLTAEERTAVLRFAACSVGTAIGYTSSLAYLPVPVAVTIFYTYPLIVILLTPYVDRIPLPPRRWFVALVAFAGVLLAIGPQAGMIDPRGVAFALFGSFSCAGMFLAGARLTAGSTLTFFWCQMVALPLGLAFAWAAGGLTPISALAVAVLPLAINFAGYFFGFLFQILAAPRISAASAGLLFLFEPVVAIIAAGLVLGEGITTLQGLGMALVIGALVVDLLPSLRQRGPADIFGP